MAFSIGGFARGVSQGLEDVRRFENIKENKEERDYRKKTRDEDAAYKTERKALIESSPVYQFYRDEQQQKQEAPHPASTGLGLLAQPQGDAVIQSRLPADMATQSVVPTAQPAQAGARPPLSSAVNQPVPAAGLSALPEQPKPPKEVPGLNDHLDLGIRATMLDLKYGKGDGAGLLTLLKTRNTMEREGVTDALKMMNAGDIEGGMSQFNGVGKYRGAQVVDFKQGTYDIGNGTALPTYLVRIRNKEGNISTINTALSLYQTSKANDIIKQAMEMRKQGETERQNRRKQGETERHNRATEANTARGMDIKESAAEKKANAVKPVKYPQRQTILDAQDLITGDPELSKLGEDDQKKLSFNVAARAQKYLTENPGSDASDAMSAALEEEVQNITPGEQRSRLGMDWLAKDKPPAYVDRRRAPGMPAAAPASPAAQPKPAASTPAQPMPIGGDDDYHQLPSGALFVGPDGVTRRKP
jgi:hypothetical protein